MDSALLEQAEETKHIPETQHLDFLALLKESLKIPVINLHFTSFILFTSLPLLFLMIFFENLLEKSLRDFLKLERPTVFALENWFIPYYSIYLGYDNLSKGFSETILLISTVYLIPLPLLDFLAAYFTIYLTSKIYYKDNDFGLSSLIKKDRLKSLKGFFITSLIVHFLSTAFFMGFIWLSIALYSCNLISIYDVTVIFIYLAGLVIAIPKYLEANAMWNLALVVSVVGDIHGVDALAISIRFSKGKEKVGRYLMMVFLVWGFALRIPGVFYDDGKVGVIGRSILLWLGSLFKWIVCVVYCYKCMGDVLDKRMAGKDGDYRGGGDKEDHGGRSSE